MAGDQGFEYVSPWMPSRNYDGMYCIGLVGRVLFRWRLIRRHETPHGGPRLVSWVLDESRADLEPAGEGALLEHAKTWDDPRVLARPRDRLEAAERVLARFDEERRKQCT